MLTVDSGLDETILITSTHTSGVGIGGEWGFGGGVGGGGGYYLISSGIL